MKKTLFVLGSLVVMIGLFIANSFNNTAISKENTVNTSSQYPLKGNSKEIYFAGGCFWGIEKLFESINGVLSAESGYANGKDEVVPTYQKVITGTTGYRETVRVVYDPSKVRLEQLLTAYFYVIDPTIEKRQGNDIGDQYQTGIYYTDFTSSEIVKKFAQTEAKKYPKFVVEIKPLTKFYLAEEYHQNYLEKNPNGYCHILPKTFGEINDIIKNVPVISAFEKPSDEVLRQKLTPLQYEVTQNAATERAFTGEYWNHKEKGIYVDITTGEPLFSSLDKFDSSCGWPSFQAPIQEQNILLKEDKSFGMNRIEVKSKAGDSHLGHVFYGEPESPNGVRYCINSASLKFIPYEEMDKAGYGDYKYLFDKK